MPLPTSSQPRKNIGIDELISELNMPKEEFNQADRAVTDASAWPPGMAAPGQPTAPPAPGAPFNPYANPWEPAPPVIDAEAARRAGERAAKMANGALSLAASLIAKEKDTDKYSASEGEIKDLAESFTDVALQYQFTVNPWLSVAVLMIAIYGPKFLEAINDRRINKLRDEIGELRTEKNDLENRVANLERDAR